MNNKELNKELEEISKQKEESDKLLLSIEIVILVLSAIVLYVIIMISSYAQIEEELRTILIIVGIIPFAVCVIYAIRIEQIAGYYECRKCNHKYVPKFITVFISMHLGRTRYMKCPECNQRSWQKKVISK